MILIFLQTASGKVVTLAKSHLFNLFSMFSYVHVPKAYSEAKLTERPATSEQKRSFGHQFESARP